MNSHHPAKIEGTPASTYSSILNKLGGLTEPSKTTVLAERLITVAKSLPYGYTRSGIEAQQKLTQALILLSSIIANAENKGSDKEATALDQVRQCVAGYEATQRSEENAEFKKNEKKQIKEIQRELGYRRK